MLILMRGIYLNGMNSYFTPSGFVLFGAFFYNNFTPLGFKFR